jgi:hypothetical protein
MESMRELAHETWSEYFDYASRELVGAPVTIETAASPGQATRTGSGRMALYAISYDHCSDTFAVSAARNGEPLPTVRAHRVDHPARVVVDNSMLLAPITITVDGRDGARMQIRIDRGPDLTD